MDMEMEIEIQITSARQKKEAAIVISNIFDVFL